MLKYQFTAKYKDGTTFEQNAEDKSAIEPEKRSAFFDVDHSKLMTFTLNGAGHSYMVDLEDGHFEIDGVPVVMHEKPIKDLKLIYYRQHTHEYRVTKATQGAVEREVAPKELSHQIAFVLGWQCTVDGENVQQVIRIV